MKTHKTINILVYLQFAIVLILIPIIIISKISFDSKEYCIDITFIPDNDPYFVSKLLAKRDYSIFNYTHSDPKILKCIEEFAGDLEKDRNDSFGIKVIINNNIKYGAFIDLISTCLKSGISDWLSYGDSLYVFHRDYKVSLAPDAPLFQLNFEDIYMEKWYKKISYNIEKISIFSIFYLIILYLSYRQIKNEC